MLKKVFMLSACVGLSALVLFSTPARAKQSVGGGVIHFVGEIVEKPCTIEHQQDQLALSCEQNNRTQTRYFTPQQVMNAPQHFQQLASVKMTYLNQKKDLALMVVEYR